MNEINLLWALIVLVIFDVLIHVFFSWVRYRRNQIVLWEKELVELQKKTRLDNAVESEEAIAKRLSKVPHIKKRGIFQKIIDIFK